MLIYVDLIQRKRSCCTFFLVFDLVIQQQMYFGTEFCWCLKILTHSCTDCCLDRRTKILKSTMMIAISWHVQVHVGLAFLGNLFLVLVTCRVCSQIDQFLSYFPLLERKNNTNCDRNKSFILSFYNIITKKNVVNIRLVFMSN